MQNTHSNYCLTGLMRIVDNPLRSAKATFNNAKHRQKNETPRPQKQHRLPLMVSSTQAAVKGIKPFESSSASPLPTPARKHGFEVNRGRKRRKRRQAEECHRPKAFLKLLAGAGGMDMFKIGIDLLAGLQS